MQMQDRCVQAGTQVIRFEDPYRPGEFFTVENPNMFNRDGHAYCPICTKVRAKALEPIDFDFVNVDPNNTLPFRENP